MAGNNQQYSLSNDRWQLEVEWTLTAAGAIVPNADGSTTTEPLVSVVRSVAGTYVVTIPGSFQKTLHAEGTFRTSGATSVQAQVTAISLGGGTPTPGGESTTTVTVITGNSNAVPAAADQASGTVGLKAVFQKHKF
jgi:hypothetical protein